MAQPGRPRTPLRRVSQGSLSALAKSQIQLPGSTGLEFLEPAFVELADECELLIGNMDGLNKLSDSLDAFNEGFASYLFVLKMNTLCVEWPEVCMLVSIEGEWNNSIMGWLKGPYSTIVS